MSRKDKFGLGDSLLISFDIPEGEEHLVKVSGLVDEEDEMPEFVGADGIEYLVAQADKGWYVRSAEANVPITIKNKSYFKREDQALQALEDFSEFLRNRSAMAEMEGEFDL